MGYVGMIAFGAGSPQSSDSTDEAFELHTLNACKIKLSPLVIYKPSTLTLALLANQQLAFEDLVHLKDRVRQEKTAWHLWSAAGKIPSLPDIKKILPIPLQKQSMTQYRKRRYPVWAMLQQWQQKVVVKGNVSSTGIGQNGVKAANPTSFPLARGDQVVGRSW